MSCGSPSTGAMQYAGASGDDRDDAAVAAGSTFGTTAVGPVVADATAGAAVGEGMAAAADGLTARAAVRSAAGIVGTAVAETVAVDAGRS